jgi:hypothetical protein
MGTWGTGTFDGDGPCDYLDGVLDRLEEDIEGCFAGELNLGDGEDVLVPALQIWSVLHERCGGHLPEPEKIRQWRDAYLPVYDRQMPELADEAFTAERRKIIQETFDRIEKQSREYVENVRKTLGGKQE